MEDYLKEHLDIIYQISNDVIKRYAFNCSEVKPINGQFIYDYGYRFQLGFFLKNTDPMREIFLKFDIRDTDLTILLFDGVNGIKRYKKNDCYRGLLDDIEKYIQNKILKYSR